jgi:N-acetylmuramoyl-L-alanine amidase
MFSAVGEIRVPELVRQAGDSFFVSSANTITYEAIWTPLPISFNTAKLLPNNQNVTESGNLSSGQNRNYFRIDNDKLSILEINLTVNSATTDHRIRVFDAQRNELLVSSAATNSLNQTTLRIVLSANRTYYIRVARSSSSSLTSNYTLNVKRKEILNNRVFLDPGHGGNDSGAIPFFGNTHGQNYFFPNHPISPYDTNENYHERELSFETAKSTATQLKRIGFEIRMSRENNLENPSLSLRTARANAFEPQLFVSFHNNAGGRIRYHPGGRYTDDHGNRYDVFQDPTSNGIETWYASTQKAQDVPNRETLSLRMAEITQEKLKTYFRNDRGLKRDNPNDSFIVLGQPNCASVLIECGFITNDIDLETIFKDKEKLGEDIANAIAEWFYLYG